MRLMKRTGKAAALALVFALCLVFGLVSSGPADALAQLPSGEALVWQSVGTPDRPDIAGTLFWHAPGRGEPVNLSDVPNEGAGTRVFPCGPDAVSPDGSYMVAYIGPLHGAIYRLPLDRPGDSGEIIRWGEAGVLACNGNGRARFSPDGERWAYLDYPVNVTSGLYPAGTLRVLSTADGSQVESFDNVVAFDLRDDGLYYVQFFPRQGNAVEAAVYWWDGADSDRLQTLAPATDCNWRSAALDSVDGSDRVVISLAERCGNGSQWRLFSFAGQGEVNEHVYMPSGGGYFTDSFTNQVYWLPGGQGVLATFPNGRAKNIANLVLVTLDNNTVTLITPAVTVDSYPDGRAGHLRFSPDGRFLAYVSTTPNNEFTIHRLAVDGSLEPVSIPIRMSVGVTISTFFFRPDGGLAYVAGGADGDDNALFLLPAGADEPTQITGTYGQYMRAAGLATHDHALLLEHVPPPEGSRTPSVNLVGITFDGGDRVVLVEGRAAGNAFAYPLAWR